MLKSFLKWAGIALGVIIVLLIITVGILYFQGMSKVNRTYQVQVEQVTIPTDAASVEHGKHLAFILCAGCHGPDLGGTAFFDDPALGSIHAKNLTTGKGGIGVYYKDADYIRTLRHGVNPDGISVFVMPSNNFHYLSDKDLGDIVAYLKSAPPVDKEWGARGLKPMGLLLTGMGVFDTQFTASQIDQTGPRPTSPAVGVTTEYGEYLVTLSDCRSCHGKQLSGGRIPDPTITAFAPNLTPGGDPGSWSEADFIKTIRTGTTPAGQQLSENMPWKDYAKFSDDELKAMWTYIHGLPKLTTTTQ